MASGRYLVGYDLGSSSVKVSIVDAETGLLVCTAQSPQHEMAIQSPHPGWAEQDPMTWWEHAIKATRQAINGLPGGYDIESIGISYQMHGLVVIDRHLKVLRPSIIWCDSRAVRIGDEAFHQLGEEHCNTHLLNSPGNFTASKLRWIQLNEPYVYDRIYKLLLPGDFLALQMTGEPGTTIQGLTEGIFWDYRSRSVSERLMRYYGFDRDLLPKTVPTFGLQGTLIPVAADALGLPPGIPICYRSGDQPNNAYSVKALHPGEVAATAGTSGVIYAITDEAISDSQQRINTFAHVNHQHPDDRYGLLLCVNGTGILNRWIKNNWTGYPELTYEDMNDLAAQVSIGSEGLVMLPFGNGAERMLGNRYLRASIHGLDLNQHQKAHVIRAAQEGIAYSLGYGFQVLSSLGATPSVIRAGHSNLFLSKVFCEAFAHVTNTTLELYNTNGSQAAARGGGVGKGLFSSIEESLTGLQLVARHEPEPAKRSAYLSSFDKWQEQLKEQLK